MKRELPYVFDLLWDVKSYEQVERIAKYEADCSDASPEDLVKLFQQEGIEIPECLSEVASQVMSSRRTIKEQQVMDKKDKKFLKELEDDLIYYCYGYYASEIDGVMDFVKDYIKQIREEVNESSL